MKSSDLSKLGYQFMINAIKVKPDEKIGVEYIGPKAKVFADACAREVKKVGATPFLVDHNLHGFNEVVKNMPIEEIIAWNKNNLAMIKEMQGYIIIYDEFSILRKPDLSVLEVPDEIYNIFAEARHFISDYYCENDRWLFTKTPTEEYAVEYGIEFENLENMYLEACLLNYDVMAEAVKPLNKLMVEGKKVHIYSPNQNTDLSFSIKNIPAIAWVGNKNMPDGECGTAPVKDSVNGKITFGSSQYVGQKFEFIKLEVKDGKVIKATAENDERTEALNEILDVDEGARYFGEFAINFNPYIKHPIGDALFDEKIDGGIHLAVGNCYERYANNGNKSAYHWDMIQIQRPEYGGGEIWVDDRLIRKDGLFVVPELEGLNPENLLAANKKSKLKSSFTP